MATFRDRAICGKMSCAVRGEFVTVRSRVPFEAICDRSRSGAVRGEKACPGGLDVLDARITFG